MELVHTCLLHLGHHCGQDIGYIYIYIGYIGYNETIDIDHGSVKLASQSLDSSLNASPLYFFIANVITYRL